jgi:hypothetical protein
MTIRKKNSMNKKIFPIRGREFSYASKEEYNYDNEVDELLEGE